ncbi:MAG: ATP-binding protein [Egibacteraceae bacterium]
MPRRRLSVALNILLLVFGVLIALVIDYLANTAGVSAPVFRLLQRWALPLLGIAVVLTVGVQVWLYLLERPPPPKRVWDSSRPPYPGLEAFVEQDAGVFFGREADIDELCDRLHPTLTGQAHRFVAVIGPSGAGKSSLVYAGLLPRLAQQRRWVVVPPLVPEADPTRSLARSLAAGLPGADVDTLAGELAAGPAALVWCVERLRVAHAGRAVSALVVIDQAEELLTLTGEQERLAFLGLLDDALRDDLRLWVVATLRSEFVTGWPAAFLRIQRKVTRDGPHLTSASQHSLTCRGKEQLIGSRAAWEPLRHGGSRMKRGRGAGPTSAVRIFSTAWAAASRRPRPARLTRGGRPVPTPLGAIGGPRKGPPLRLCRQSAAAERLAGALRP